MTLSDVFGWLRSFLFTDCESVIATYGFNSQPLLARLIHYKNTTKYALRDEAEKKEEEYSRDG